jgi:hypothetical protein
MALFASLFLAGLVAAPAALAPANAEGNNDTVVVYDPYSPTMNGRAFGFGFTKISALGVSVPDGFTADTGWVHTQGSSVTSAPCGVIASSILQATLGCPFVVTDAEDQEVRSTVAVANARLGVPLLPVVEARAVEAKSSSQCSGGLYDTDGSTTIAYLKVGSQVVISKPTPIAPNTKIKVGVVSLTLNEQIDHDGAGLTVNAIHVKANVLNLAKEDVIISSAYSEVNNCHYYD